MARIFTDGGAQSLATVAQQTTCLTSFSVAFWMNRTATPAAARAIIAATIAAVANGGWYVQLTTGNLILAGYPMSTTDKQRTSSTAPTLNTWMHVIVTHNQTGLANTDFTFYFNGKSEAGTATATGVGTHDSTTATKLEIGSGNVGLAPPAQLGPIAIWNRAISPAEALSLASGEHPLRFKEGLVELFDMATAAGEEGWLTKLYLVQGATNPTSAAVSPPMLAPPGSQPGETHLNVRSTVRSRARYIANAAAALTILPDFGALTLAGFAPTVNLPITVLPALGALALTGFAPTVTTPTVVSPSFGQLLLAGFAPSIGLPLTLTPGVGAATLTGFAPTVGLPQTVTPGVGALSLTGFAPAVGLPLSVKPDVGALQLTGFAPTIDVTSALSILPGTGALQLDGFAPTLGLPLTVTLGVGALSVTGFEPTIVVGGAPAVGQSVVPNTVARLSNLFVKTYYNGPVVNQPSLAVKKFLDELKVERKKVLTDERRKLASLKAEKRSVEDKVVAKKPVEPEKVRELDIKLGAQSQVVRDARKLYEEADKTRSEQSRIDQLAEYALEQWNIAEDERRVAREEEARVQREIQEAEDEEMAHVLLMVHEL